jgi:hypothetical protein
MLGVILLAWLFVERAGPMRPDSLEKGVLEFQPAVHKELIAATNALRQNLLALGLESRAADEILDLRRYLELKAQEKSGKFRNEKPSEPRIQQGQGSSSAGNETGSQDPAVFDEKQGSESLLDEKSPTGQGSDIDQSGAILSDGQGDDKK